MSTFEQISELNAYELASLADVLGPDSPTSAGAEWLVSIRNGVVEALQSGTYFFLKRTDAAMEAVSDAVPVYTHNKWQVFIDLGAYREDVAEVTNLDDAASYVLQEIAERLAMALVDLAADDDDEEV